MDMDMDMGWGIWVVDGKVLVTNLFSHLSALALLG
jgi:hypothetical protein